MGFHNVMSANWHKNMGYRGDDSVIRQERMGYCVVMSEWRGVS